MKSKWLQEIYDVIDRANKSAVKKEPVVITVKGHYTDLALIINLSKQQLNDFILALVEEK